MLCDIASSHVTRETPGEILEHAIPSVQSKHDSFQKYPRFVACVSNIERECGEIDLLDPSSLMRLDIMNMLTQ